MDARLPGFDATARPSWLHGFPLRLAAHAISAADKLQLRLQHKLPQREQALPVTVEVAGWAHTRILVHRHSTCAETSYSFAKKKEKKKKLVTRPSMCVEKLGSRHVHLADELVLLTDLL